MDNMENTMVTGIDDMLDGEAVRPEDGTNVIKMRKPWIEWNVGDKVYKLKLTARAITQLEKAFGKSLLMAVMDEGIPPVSTEVTLLQAAMQKYNHGIKSDDVGDIFDKYIDEGGNQVTLLKDVVYPLMHDAGFFTDGQMRMLTREIADADTTL